MKKLFAIVAMLGLFATAPVYAQNQNAPAAPVAPAVVDSLNANVADSTSVPLTVEQLKENLAVLEAKIANTEGMDSAAIAAVKAEIEAVQQ